MEIYNSYAEALEVLKTKGNFETFKITMRYNGFTVEERCAIVPQKGSVEDDKIGKEKKS